MLIALTALNQSIEVQNVLIVTHSAVPTRFMYDKPIACLEALKHVKMSSCLLHTRRYSIICD